MHLQQWSGKAGRTCFKRGRPVIAIGITDIDWFMQLRAANFVGEVNFWTPTPWRFKSLSPGELFYFLVKSPIRKVGGFGAFVRYEEMRASEAWDRYGPGNGVSDLGELIQRVHKYADRHSIFERDRMDPEIGCIVLNEAVFLPDDEFAAAEDLGTPVPNAVVKFKSFANIDSLGIGTMPPTPIAPFVLVEPGRKAKRQTSVVDRQGQQVFRVQVLQAYGNMCAVTNERCEAVVEAAHIQPYINRQSNDVRNGIALRSDLHALFDAGLITIDEGYRLRVSKLLQSPTYQALNRRQIGLPNKLERRPSTDALEYHRRFVFREPESES